jgi:hypothetical protein
MGERAVSYSAKGEGGIRGDFRRGSKPVHAKIWRGAYSLFCLPPFDGVAGRKPEGEESVWELDSGRANGSWLVDSLFGAGRL